MMYLTRYALVSIELHHHHHRRHHHHRHHHRHHHHHHPVVRMKTLNILKKREAKAPEDICNLCETKIKSIYEHLQSNGIMSHVLRIKIPELIHFRSQLAQ